MKRIFAISLLLTAIFLSGCVETSTIRWSAPEPGQKSTAGNKVVWNLQGYNCGVFLFYFIPIWSGDAYGPNRRDFELFENHLDYWHMRRQLDKLLSQLEADAVEDVNIQTSATGAFGLWIFWRRSITSTAVAVKKEK